MAWDPTSIPSACCCGGGRAEPLCIEDSLPVANALSGGCTRAHQRFCSAPTRPRCLGRHVLVRLAARAAAARGPRPAASGRASPNTKTHRPRCTVVFLAFCRDDIVAALAPPPTSASPPLIARADPPRSRSAAYGRWGAAADALRGPTSRAGPIRSRLNWRMLAATWLGGGRAGPRPASPGAESRGRLCGLEGPGRRRATSRRSPARRPRSQAQRAVENNGYLGAAPGQSQRGAAHGWGRIRLAASLGAARGPAAGSGAPPQAPVQCALVPPAMSESFGRAGRTVGPTAWILAHCARAERSTGARECGTAPRQQARRTGSG